MKKSLISTTALVGVGALAASGAAQQAQAADPLSLTVGGYLQADIEYRSEDDGNSDPGGNRNPVNIYDDGEIQFTASTTLDNGIGVRARIEYEAKNQGNGSTIVDERYLDFSGSFGQLRIGGDDNASNAMQYQAPGAAPMMGVNTGTFAVPLAGSNAVGSYPVTYLNTGGDSEKIIWFSPRIAGFQLGVSYAPSSNSNDQTANRLINQPNFDNGSGQSDIFSVGLNYVESFNDVDVAVAGGYIHGNANSSNQADDEKGVSAGLNVGFAGFTVGASIRVDNNGANNSDSTTWDAGVTYATGPLTVGFTYVNGQAENANVGGDDETNQFVVSGMYNIGPGVDLWGGVKYFDYESDNGGSGNENEGYIIALGSSVSF